MTYRVTYMPRVVSAIDEQVKYLLDQRVSPARVTAWLNDLYDLADSLERFPKRHAVAVAESEELGIEIRKVIFGDYLLFYQVDDENNRVNVLHFRHGANETNRLMSDDASFDV